MVSKLLLAVQETYQEAHKNGATASELAKLKQHYYTIKDGIGLTKTPQQYGAFPTDPYSHTPAHAGAQQPGMTGQVKEDYISRFGELGVTVENGCLRFNPSLMNQTEWLTQPAELNGVVAKSGQLGFTVCGIPVMYSKSTQNNITVKMKNGTDKNFSKLELDAETSRNIFNRNGTIEKILVNLMA